jgi:hypothetical protein
MVGERPVGVKGSYRRGTRRRKSQVVEQVVVPMTAWMRGPSLDPSKQEATE